jgi:hypothetical protein
LLPHFGTARLPNLTTVILISGLRIGRFYHLSYSIVKKLTELGKRVIAIGNRIEHTAVHNAAA